MTDLAAAYGRGDALGWNLPGPDPLSVGPGPTDALDVTPFYQGGQSARGRWRIYSGHFATSPPNALSENPHTIWNTGGGNISPWSDPSPVTPYIRRRFGFWDTTRTYGKDECVVVRTQGLWAYRSLRDGNLNHDPFPAGQPLGMGDDQICDSTAPDWWQAFGHFSTMAGGTGFKLNNSTKWNFNAPGVTNWPGYTASPRTIWSGRPVEASTQVGANQWAGGECQADWIGPGVRLSPDAQDGYYTYAEYVGPFTPDWYDGSGNLDPSGVVDNAPKITAQPTEIRLARLKGGVATVLQSWSITPVCRSGAAGSGATDVVPGTDGPWCVRLSVVDDAQGRPVLTVWTRFWGYDPYERDLDLYPWKLQGSYTDASASAIHLGQPGFIVWPKPYYELFVDGETWWGWGEMGGATAPRESYSLDAESKPGSPTVSADAAFSAPSASLVATAAAFVIRAGTPTLSQTVAQTLAASAGALALTPGMPWLAQARRLSASPASLSLSPGLPTLSQHALSLFKAPDGTALPFRVWSGSQWVEVPVRLWNGSQFN